MTALLWLCVLPLVAEFSVAPFNLWSGRTMGNFARFTALSPAVARNVFAPAKLAGAALLAVGLALRVPGAVGAGLIAVVSAVYLVRMSDRKRRYLDGLAAFGISFALAVAALTIELSR